MPEIRSLKALEKYLSKQIDDVLLNEVSKAVKDVEQEAIADVVYAVYPEPGVYDRRIDDGGLADKDHMIERLDAPGVLRITNDTPFDHKYETTNPYGPGLDDLVEYGDGYNGYEYFFKGGPYELPRPFTQETVNRLNASKEHLDQLWAGLRRRGIHVE